MDLFEDVKLTDIIKDSLSKLLNRDLSAVTFSSGTSFPTSLSEDMVGRICNRTDLKTLYVLTSTNPVQWEVVLDYSSPILNTEEVAALYQPLNDNLTAFSNVSSQSNAVPFFIKDGEMSTFQLTTLGKNILGSANAQAVRTLLGLSALATKSKIENSDITDDTITLEKLAFTPISAEHAFKTGDIKEVFSYAGNEDGWIDMTVNSSIGSSTSNASYKGAQYHDLFVLLWNWIGDSFSISSGKGASAEADWTENKTITFLSNINPLSLTTKYRIKI